MVDDFTKLKSLLLQEEINKINEMILEIRDLKDQHKQETLVDRLSGLITQILSQSIQENQGKLYATLQPLFSKALLDELNSSNNDLKKILFPIISSAIQDQVHKQKDTIVDALYPIMGNMISRYVSNAFSQMMYDVNDKIQNTLSFALLQRKIKSKLYGVSEAALLMQESNFTDVKSIFLIHKESGLLITDIHREESERIDEAEMVASMLSAIRSFVNEWIENHKKLSEISEIEYGDSSISIESAGSFYLAVVARGDSKSIDDKITSVVSKIAEKYSQEIANYDGDKSKIDIFNMQGILSTLFDNQVEKPKKKFPLISTLILLMLLSLPLYFYITHSYKEYQKQERKKQIEKILSNSDIHVYDLDIDINDKNYFSIAGLLLNKRDYEATKSLLSGYRYTNNIRYIEDKFQTNYTKEQLNKEIYRFNKLYDSNISYLFEDHNISFQGTVIDERTKEEFLDNSNSIFDHYNLHYDIDILSKINDRIYFDVGSSEVLKKYKYALNNIAILQKRYGNYGIKITAYTDTKGSASANKKVSYDRAYRVREELTKRGVAKKMIGTEYKITPPPDIMNSNSEKEQSLSRCVTFEWSVMR